MTGRLYVGGDYRLIYDIPVFGGDASFGLSWELAKGISICLSVDYAIGTRGYGLGVRIGTLGVDAGYRLGRLRIGLGAGVGFVSLDRATAKTEFIVLGHALWLMASYDIAQWGEHRQRGIFVGARLETTVPFGSTNVWGPSAGVGIRF